MKKRKVENLDTGKKTAHIRLDMSTEREERIYQIFTFLGYENRSEFYRQFPLNIISLESIDKACKQILENQKRIITHLKIKNTPPL